MIGAGQPQPSFSLRSDGDLGGGHRGEKNDGENWEVAKGRMEMVWNKRLKEIQI